MQVDESDKHQRMQGNGRDEQEIAEENEHDFLADISNANVCYKCYKNTPKHQITSDKM
jgi:hypothetical protein